jgi:Spy/CpxP family protein refolding chaperone
MINPLKTASLLFVLLLSPFFYHVSAQGTKVNTPDPAYTKMIAERADKIVKALKLTDSLKAKRVSKIVAKQYSDLNDIYTIRDNKIKDAKAQASADKKTTDDAIASVQNQATAAIDQLHPKYLASLSKELTGEQVTAIKDGMTYNVANITYNGYLDEVPTLTEAQRAQIKAWLVEAREHAMDAESSEKKHAWFGKYKGRINNYLSAAGIDMKKAGEEWQQRIKERTANKTDKSQ